MRIIITIKLNTLQKNLYLFQEKTIHNINYYHKSLPRQAQRVSRHQNAGGGVGRTDSSTDDTM